MRSYKQVSMVLLNETIRFCFPFREDLLRFEVEAKKILSPETLKDVEISDYPRKFYWVPYLNLSHEEEGKLIELAYKIVNE